MSFRHPITFLAIAQVGGLVYVCLAAAAFYKVGITVFPEHPEFRFSGDMRTALAMSHWGWLLMAIPLAWLLAAFKFQDFDGDSVRGNTLIYVSGAILMIIVGLTALGFTTMIYSQFFRY